MMQCNFLYNKILTVRPEERTQCASRRMNDEKMENKMTELSNIRCVGCEGGIPALTKEEINQLLPEVSGWEVDPNGKSIRRRFTFKGFYKTMAFVNAIAWIANTENHHPDMEVGYNYCLVKYTTHAVDGLTKNDFICAAKVNELGAVV